MGKQYAIAFSMAGSSGDALTAVINLAEGNSICLSGGKNVELQPYLPPGLPALNSFSVGAQQIAVSAPAQAGQTLSVQVVVSVAAGQQGVTGNFPNSGAPCTLTFQFLGYTSTGSNGEIEVGSFTLPFPDSGERAA